MKLYNELAEWWPLLSATEDYEEEANIYANIISKYTKNIQTCLELGSGGGNNAFYLKKQYKMTLTDVSEAMLNVSKRINQDCDHIQGDMRNIRLAKKFDLVFIHDAICYITDESELLQVFQTAKQHLSGGGLVFIMPDEFSESFVPGVNCGGHDKGNKGLRFLEWTYDPDPGDSRVTVQYAYIMRDDDGRIYHEHDQSEYGLFSKNTWEALMHQAGFEVHFEQVEYSDQPGHVYYGIVGILHEA